LPTKLLAKGVTKLAKAYTTVHDLDSLRSNYNTRSFDSKSSAFRTSSSQFNRPSIQTPHIGMTSRIRVLNGTTKTKAPSSPKLVPQPSATNANVMDT